MKKRKLILFLIWLMNWTATLTTLDWVLNRAVYTGMEQPFWLMQIPFTTTVIYLTGWHAYLYCLWWLHILTVPLLLYWIQNR